MKTIVLFFAAISLSLAPAQGDVVVNSNFTLVPDTFSGANYRFTAFQNEPGTDPTSLWVALNGQFLLPVVWNVDEEADYYLVPNSAVFSAATISLGIFPPLFRLDTPSSLNVGFGDFYLGINTGQGLTAPGQPRRDVFGWVHLVNNQQTGLTMIGNAMSYGGQGIIVGTTVVVPEPSFVILFGLGTCLAMIGRRSWNSAKVRNPPCRRHWFPLIKSDATRRG